MLTRYAVLMILAGLLSLASRGRAEDSPVRRLFEQGDFRQTAAATAATADDAACRLEALLYLGEYTRIAADAAAALTQFGEHDAVRALAAEALLVQGDLEGARTQCRGDGPACAMLRMDLLELTGQKKELSAAAGKVIGQYMRNAPQDIYSVLALAAALRHENQFQDAMNVIQAFKPARRSDQVRLLTVTGDMFSAKYNDAAAAKEYQAALKLNPAAVPALAGMARMMLERGAVEDSTAYSKQIMQLDPRSLTAALLTAYARLMEENYAAAEQALESVFAVNPAQPEGLAVKAAILKTRRDAAAFEAVVRQAEQGGYAAGRFYFPLSQILTNNKKGDDALGYLQQLLAADPDDAGVLSAIGWILLRKGQMEDAKALFERAHAIDSFDFRTFNVLNLLDKLEAYNRRETAHFRIIYDPAVDEVAARFFEGCLEEMYAGLAAEYDYELGTRCYIFLFPSHAYLAVMTIGLPSLGMPALCVGNSVYCDTPNILKTHLSMNWYKTMRHELVHVVTLLGTDFNIPHWFTEGLAVMSEQVEHRYQWDQVLLRAGALGLFHAFDDMNVGFYHTGDQLGRLQAYAEGYLAMLYIVKNHGREAIRGYLEQFKAGRSFREATPLVLKIDQDTLQTRFNAYRETYLQGCHIAPLFIEPDMEELQVRATEGDREAMAWILIQSGDQRVAAMVQAALDRAGEGDTDQLRTALAVYHYRAGEIDAALEQLGGVVLPRGFDFYRVRGLCLLKQSDFPAALEMFNRAWEEYGWEAENIYDIARLHLDRGNDAEYARWMDRFMRADDSNIDRSLEYALHLTERKDFIRAVSVLESAIRANPSHPDVRLLLGRTFLQMRRPEQAAEEYRMAALVKPLDLKINTDLVKVLRYLKREDEAQQVLERLGHKYPAAKIDELLR